MDWSRRATPLVRCVAFVHWTLLTQRFQSFRSTKTYNRFNRITLCCSGEKLLLNSAVANWLKHLSGWLAWCFGTRQALHIARSMDGEWWLHLTARNTAEIVIGNRHFKGFKQLGSGKQTKRKSTFVFNLLLDLPCTYSVSQICYHIQLHCELHVSPQAAARAAVFGSAAATAGPEFWEYLCLYLPCAFGKEHRRSWNICWQEHTQEAYLLSTFESRVSGERRRPKVVSQWVYLCWKITCHSHQCKERWLQVFMSFLTSQTAASSGCGTMRCGSWLWH